MKQNKALIFLLAALTILFIPICVFGGEVIDNYEGEIPVLTSSIGTLGDSMDTAPDLSIAPDINESSINNYTSSWKLNKKDTDYWLKFTTSPYKSFYRIDVKNYSIGNLWDDGIGCYLMTYDENELWSGWIKVNNDKMNFIKLDAGTVYYLRFRTDSTVPGNFGVSIAQNRDDIGDEKEDSTEVFPENEYNYGIQGYDDVDRFKMRSSDNDSFYKFTVRNNSIPYSNFSFKVYSDQGKEGLSFSPYQNEEVSSYVKMHHNADYYIVVSSLYSSIGRYAFMINEIKDDVPDQKENGELITRGSNIVRKIDAPNDVDWFKYTAPKSGELTFRIKPYADYETSFWFYDENERLLYSKSAWSNNEEKGLISVEADNDYYIRVQSANIGSYEFSIDREEKKDTIDNDVLYYSISTYASEGGTISPSQTVSVKEGENQKFIITPDRGYRISTVYVDGAEIGDVSEYTFYDVNEDHTIRVYFVEDDYKSVYYSSGTDRYVISYKETVSFNGKKHLQKGRGKDTRKKAYDVEIILSRVDGSVIPISDYKTTFKKNKKAGQGYFKIKLKGKKYKKIKKDLKKKKFGFTIL